MKFCSSAALAAVISYVVGTVPLWCGGMASASAASAASGRT